MLKVLANRSVFGAALSMVSMASMALGASALWMASSGAALAQLELDISGGRAFPSASGYEADVFANAALGYDAGAWAARAGYLHLGEFELESASTQASITMNGPYLQAVRRFDTRLVTWELGVGAARLKSEARLGGRLLDTQTDWDAFAEVALTQKVADQVHLKGSYLYFNDRLGSDVSAVSVGVRFSF